ncbi:MAG TPA: bifunctional UDP-sugar hydrolase/5'-nucleotidase, partial [Myxococcaceae bacterium]|nr:bifunctional UDP-sugar hydrolase/5'-nucleotidase [Myxococcaceae bacterium]
MRFPRVLSLASVALLVGAEVRAEHCIQIVSTSDVRGHLIAPSPREGRTAESGGGVATLGGYVAILRKRYPGQVLLVDAGDLLGGTLESNTNRGAAMIAAYNALGYQALVLGNHELDFGADGDASRPQGTLEERAREAKFPILACNVFGASTGKRPEWLQASRLVDVGGLSVGIIGVANPQTAILTNPAHAAGLTFKPGIDEVAAEAVALRKKGARVLVLLAHQGCAETFELLDKLPPKAIDVAIGSHTHEYVARVYGSTAFCQAGADGDAFGWTELCVNNENKVVTNVHDPVTIRGPIGGASDATFLDQPIVPSADVERVIRPFLRQAEKRGEVLLGISLAQPLARDKARTSRLGQLVAEGVRHAVPGAQIGWVNEGGLRADLPQGPLRFSDVFDVLPFEEQVVRLQLTGSQLRAMLVAPVRGSHGFPQLAGAHLSYSRGKATVTLTGGGAQANIIPVTTSPYVVVIQMDGTNLTTITATQVFNS